MNDELEKLRARLDRIDEEILTLFSKRLETVKNIGINKKTKNLPIENFQRFEQALDYRIQVGKKVGLESSLVKQIYTLFHSIAVDIQKKLR